jgi:hypothetical protein
MGVEVPDSAGGGISTLIEAMSPPFTTDQFFQVFAAYNMEVWPGQVFLLALAILAGWLAFRPAPWAGRASAPGGDARQLNAAASPPRLRVSGASGPH